MSCRASGRHQLFSGIADARQAGITDQRQGFAISQGLQQFRDALLLVVLVKADQPLLDAEAMQQQTAVARGFAGDAVHSCQQLLRPRREVAAVADRCSHQIENPGAGLLHNGARL